MDYHIFFSNPHIMLIVNSMFLWWLSSDSAVPALKRIMRCWSVVSFVVGSLIWIGWW